jgi:hypothetical protein
VPAVRIPDHPDLAGLWEDLKTLSAALGQPIGWIIADAVKAYGPYLAYQAGRQASLEAVQALGGAEFTEQQDAAYLAGLAT